MGGGRLLELIKDDPIIACIERTGYPPWYRDGEQEDDFEQGDEFETD